MAILGVVIVIQIGLETRNTERPIAERSRCRRAARWAAESALAHGRGMVAQNTPKSRTASGLLFASSGEVRYTLKIKHLKEGWRLLGQGTCVSRGIEIRQVAEAYVPADSLSTSLERYSEGPGGDISP